MTRSIVMAAVWAALAVPCAAEPAPYKVKAGDVLSVAVLGHPDMEKTVRVTPDGQLPYFFVGTMPVEGLSLAEINAGLARSLSERGMPNVRLIVHLAEEKKGRF